jgi:RNA polymerase sigma factor (sigma-70 family)
MSNYKADEQRLQDLATGREANWRLFYEDMRSPFRLFFLKYTGLDSATVNVLYQDAVVVLHRKVSNGDLVAPLKSSLKTYLFGVGKMLYRKQNGQTAKWEDEIPEIAIPPSVEDKIAREERAIWVTHLLNQLDEKCQDLLRKVYLEGYTMEMLAEELQLSGAGAVRKRKFDCLNRLRKLVN